VPVRSSTAVGNDVRQQVLRRIAKACHLRREPGPGRQSKIMPSINMSAAAAAAGVTASYLSRVLGGAQSPGLETAGKIAKALGVGVEEVAALRVRAQKTGKSRARKKAA